ncbi:hypothetical protein B6U99_05705 [Candidatus Geothermarchaeota archaeon ex4572_27]|nr:MAG: hypothetical protein B6U99_05705 [Candidatus Geothermarchaeota archaeon ex4572_27]
MAVEEIAYHDPSVAAATCTLLNQRVAARIMPARFRGGKVRDPARGMEGKGFLRNSLDRARGVLRCRRDPDDSRHEGATYGLSMARRSV